MIYVNDQIQKGKDLRLDLSNTENAKQSLNSNYQNLNLQLKSLIDSQKQALEHSIQLAKSQIQNQIANLKNQQQHIDSLLTQKQVEKQTIQTKLDQLQNDLNSQSKFHCAKIAADCPFISQINDSVIARTLILVNSIKAELDQNNIYISEQEKAKQ